MTHVIVHNKSGLFSLQAGCFVDATGDADVAFLSGCRTIKGRPDDHLMTPATLEMHVEGVDWKAYVEYQNAHQSPKLVERIKPLKEAGELTVKDDVEYPAVDTGKLQKMLGRRKMSVPALGVFGRNVFRSLRCNLLVPIAGSKCCT